MTFGSRVASKDWDKGEVTFDSSVRHYSVKQPELNVTATRISMYVGFLIIFIVLFIACTLVVCINRYQTINRVEEGVISKTVEMRDEVVDNEAREGDDDQHNNNDVLL